MSTRHLELDETDEAGWVGGDWPDFRRLHQAAARQAARMDAHWVERYPKLKRYVRPAVRHELCVEGEACRPIAGWVRVWFPRPGVRLRREAR